MAAPDVAAPPIQPKRLANEEKKRFLLVSATRDIPFQFLFLPRPPSRKIELLRFVMLAPFVLDKRCARFIILTDSRAAENRDRKSVTSVHTPSLTRPQTRRRRSNSSAPLLLPFSAAVIFCYCWYQQLQFVGATKFRRLFFGRLLLFYGKRGGSK